MPTLPGPASARQVWQGFLHAPWPDAVAPPAQAAVGAWVVPDDRLPGLGDDWAGVPLHLAVGGGAGALGPALTWAARTPGRLAAVGLTLRDEADLAHNARRVLAALDEARLAGTLDDDVLVVVTPPPVRAPAQSAGWLGALDELATAELHLGLRCDGPAAQVAGEVADALEAALDRELAMVCLGTSGPLTGDGPGDGLGWAHVLRAVRASLDGDDVRGTLTAPGTDPVADLDDDALTRTRRWLPAAVLPAPLQL